MNIQQQLAGFGKVINDFTGQLNTTAFGKVNTEILWYLTIPFLYSLGACMTVGVAEFMATGWLTALCAKSGVEFMRYNTDRKTEFTPEQRATADAIRANAGISVQAPVPSTINTPTPEQGGTNDNGNSQSPGRGQ